MNLRRNMKWIHCSALFLMLLNACTYSEKIYLRSQLLDPLTTGTITVMTLEKKIYRLTNYKLKDSTILGTGFLEDDQTPVPFKGELHFNNIAYVQIQKTSFWRGVKIVVPIVVFGATALAAFDGNNGLLIEPIVSYRPPIGSGGSCPFVYSWNGQEYILEAESFGAALGKGLEMNTVSVLNTIKPDADKLKIKITNERPETHFFNAIRLLAVETDDSVTVIADNYNQLWSVKKPVASILAKDHSQRNVTLTLAEPDRMYYESDMKGAAPGGKYEDMVELHFPNPTHAQNGSVIIEAINTKFSISAFNYLFGFLDEQSIEFTDAIDNDPEMIAILNQWLHDASLSVSVWNGTDWEITGALLPEANEIPFSRLIRVTAPPAARDTLKIRLTSLTDVWKLDAVTIDWGYANPLRTKEIRLQTAIHSSGNDVSKELWKNDDQYIVNFPPNEILLSCNAVKPVHGKKIVYALDARGYLYEWIGYSDSVSGHHSHPNIFPSGKLSYVKSLLRNKHIVLPFIYEEWKNIKAKSEARVRHETRLH